MPTQAVKNQAVKNINWGTPTEKEVTISDYRSMVETAEKGKGISVEQYTEKTHEWLQKNL
jgi:hypothetical protein